MTRPCPSKQGKKIPRGTSRCTAGESRNSPSGIPRPALPATLAGFFLLWLPGQALAGETLSEALQGGKVALDLRYRFEEVDQDGLSKNAKASTLRLRLGYQTGTYHHLFALADLDHIMVIGAEKFNSTSNGLTAFPKVTDPEDTEVNQAYLGFQGVKDTVFRFGRQRITLDNHRFIGNVGWRQNEQTFDAFSVRSELTDRISFFYGHINNANRIFGENHPVAAKADMNLFSDMVNISYHFPLGTLTAYGYFLETEDDPTASHRNLGLRFTGQHSVSENVKFHYTAEYADQSDYKDGASTNDASYEFVEVGVGLKNLTVKLGYEVLEGDGTYGFSTPLATLHAFNGWADKFLDTPPAGLEDLYLSVSATVYGVKLAGIYHDFSADAGGADYGSELDLLAAKIFKKIYSVGLKYASYHADTFPADTDKFWATLQLRF